MTSPQINSLKTADVSTVKVVSRNMTATHSTPGEVAGTDTTAAQQKKIRAALEANPEIMKQLKAQSVKMSQVVAADYNGNGTLTVYTR